MKEIRNIISIYNSIDLTKTKAALATVVRADGSSYRRTGARMLVMDDGVWSGGISGGCLEGDALKRARLAIAHATSSMVTYDTTEDDKHQIGVGLGCQGVIEVLFTPLIKNDPANPVEILDQCLRENRQTHILVSVVKTDSYEYQEHLGKMSRYRSYDDLAFISNASLKAEISTTIRDQIEKGKSAPHSFKLPDGKSLEIFIELLHPEIHVVMLGHQYDVFPLVSLLKELGWRSTVVADPAKILPKLYKLADKIETPENFNSILIDDHTAVLLMSHDLKTDKYNLPKALHTRASFIGMLGPKKRADRIFDELRDEGIKINESDFKKIHAPVGLDIGALTPEEIALSIASEIRAAFAQRDGAALKWRKGPIHDREK